MNLDISNWKRFDIGRLFTMLNGKGITQEEIADNRGDFIAVQSGEENNGVMGKISLNYCKQMKYTYTEKSCLTVARSGSAGFVSYQHNGCVVGDSAKILLLPDEVATIEHYLFIQTMLTANRFKYTYGRKVTEDKYLNDVVDLPVQHNNNGSIFIDDTKKYSDNGYVPDWQFMEDYIKSLHHKPLTTKNKSGQVPDLNVQDWGEFKIKDFFNVELAKGDIKLEEVDKGEIPLVSSGESNNGIVGYIDKNGDGKSEMFPANCITIDMFGNAFYQNEPFYAVSHGRVNILTPKFELTKNIGLFISTIIKKEQYKFSYGRAVYSSEAENMNIVLPVDVNGNPDWQFIEDYIKALPYGDRLEG